MCFTLHRGEVLGFFGLIGAGRTEIMEMLFGVRPHTGTIRIDGDAVRIGSPGDAIAHGMGFVTEDRKALGLFLDLSCGANINLGVIGRDAGRGGILNLAAGRRRAAAGGQPGQAGPHALVARRRAGPARDQPPEGVIPSKVETELLA